jgi:hypothetical protein
MDPFTSEQLLPRIRFLDGPIEESKRVTGCCSRDNPEELDQILLVAGMKRGSETPNFDGGALDNRGHLEDGREYVRGAHLDVATWTIIIVGSDILCEVSLLIAVEFI